MSQDEQQKLSPTAVTEAEASAATASDAEQQGENVPAPRASRSWLGWLLLLVILGGSGGAGWFGWQWWQQERSQLAQLQQQVAAQQLQQQDLQAAQARLQQQLSAAATESQLTNTQQQLTEQLQTAQQRTTEALQQQARALGSLQSEINSLDIDQTANWRLLESRELTASALRQLTLQQNPTHALALLELALSHIEALNDPRHVAIRQALLDDIELLRALPALDVTGVILQLQSTSQQLASIDWLPQPGMAIEAAQTSSDSSDWQRNLLASWRAFIGQFVQVQRHDTPVQPQLAQDQLQLLLQRTQLQFELAQLAVAQGSQARLQAALSQIPTLLTQLPRATAAQQAALNRATTVLTELQALELERALPQQLRSLTVLEEWLQGAAA